MQKQMRFHFLAVSLVLAMLLSARTSPGQQTNTAYGEGALVAPAASTLQNSAFGYKALNASTIGVANTAVGAYALSLNTVGNFNAACGYTTLYENSTGEYNTATGAQALYHVTTGSNNIALGYAAGVNLTTGHYNIDIGNSGVAGEQKTIRVGSQGNQTQTYIAGIFGSALTGDSVVVSNSGKLGVLVSSARYKRDIQDMGQKSSGLMNLRPVTFRYKNDPEGTQQYGLIAEEVAKLYPELVSYGTDGKVETVHYLPLVSMLLNELQKQARENQVQAAQIQKLTQLSAQQAEMIENQAHQNQRLSARMEELKALFEQAMAAQRESGTLAAGLSR